MKEPDISRQIYSYKTGKDLDPRVKVMFEDPATQRSFTSNRQKTENTRKAVHAKETGRALDTLAAAATSGASGIVPAPRKSPKPVLRGSQDTGSPTEAKRNAELEKAQSDGLDTIYTGAVIGGVGYRPNSRSREVTKKAALERLADAMGAPGDKYRKEADEIPAPELKWENGNELVEYYLTRGLLGLPGKIRKSIME